MQIALPELNAPATLILDPDKQLSEEEYLAFCEANPDLRIELTAQGEIIIVPPAGGDSSFGSAEVIGQLREWAKRSRLGKALDSSAAFVLPDGSILSPDSAWVSSERLNALSRPERRGFLHLNPDFIAEVVSPTDRPRHAHRKMRNWIANGVELAWLIDGEARCVHVYKPGREPQRYCDIDRIAGEGPVEGFVLELEEIWKGL